MKTLIAIPTLSRADLLLRNKSFLEGISAPDEALILDNGRQDINIAVRIDRPFRNLGVPGSWNYFFDAFMRGGFDLLVILQDDIIWDLERLETAKRLAAAHPDVDLLLSPHLWSVQVHKPSTLKYVGRFDERFSPAWCEDDDYALQMIHAGRIYQRFVELDPLPGSIAGGTVKAANWGEQRRKFKEKWGRDNFGINIPSEKYYHTNRGIKPEDL